MNQIVSERVADGIFFRLKLIELKMFGGFFFEGERDLIGLWIHEEKRAKIIL